MSGTQGKIGLFLMSDKNRHQLAARDEAVAKAKRHGLALEVFFADNIAAQQSRDVIHFLHANAEQRLCIICMPVADIDSSTTAVGDHPIHKLARRVAARGAGWIVLNRDAEAQVNELHKEFPAVPVALVTPDQKEFGRIQGRQFRALLPRGGRVLYVLGNPFVSASRDRSAGVREIIRGDRDIAIDEVDGLWAADKAKAAVAKWLAQAAQRDAWPDVVGCQNDEMALGARDALLQGAAQFGRPALAKVPVTGGDGLPEFGQKWVAERKLAATVVLPTTTGIAIDQLAHAWQTGRPMPLKTVVPVAPFPDLARLAAARD
jgi:ABC-type sugar transport system substrate-binding protein